MSDSVDPDTSALPEGITAETVNGLDAWRISTPLASGLVFAQGAHVAEWVPAGAPPVLWLSKQSFFEPGKAIRGGVPVCFPWFGTGRSGEMTPAHGFARLSQWTLDAAEVDPSGEATLALVLTGSDVEDLGGFPEDFTARLVVSMGSALQLTLTVTAGEQELDFEEALHSYFSVSDARRVQLDGLDQARYLDKVSGAEEVQQGAIEFTSETDRVYFDDGTCRILDEGAARVVTVEKAQSANTVVWNPWIDRSQRMTDFGDDEWTGMCCVETANVLDNAVHLAPGQGHSMTLAVTLS